MVFAELRAYLNLVKALRDFPEEPLHHHHLCDPNPVLKRWKETSIHFDNRAKNQHLVLLMYYLAALLNPL